ncbi:hypothetical protein FA13DRAFT_625450 [Coprinellus micaceus]|uniref:Uncharacterized protein n=1 Tax=Coprinellus micaceus TaxID=71717 RepID=A0A4Y7T723_COPMI|nr:hypothetical protein FA13DRAFT_625450 [Coprinellus micaceus]
MSTTSGPKGRGFESHSRHHPFAPHPEQYVPLTPALCLLAFTAHQDLPPSQLNFRPSCLHLTTGPIQLDPFVPTGRRA